MSQFVNWEYYSSLYAKASESDFTKLEALAEKEVELVIGPIRWAGITTSTYGFAQLKDCICKTIDEMIDSNASAKGKGVSSVSNDGYSESYVVQTADQLRTELHTSIKAWLSGTGLVGAY